MAPIDRTNYNALVNEPPGGDNTTGSVWDKNAIKTVILDPVDAAIATVQTTTSTGTVNDFALTAGATLLRLNNATALTLTGITAGYDGQRLDLVSVGAGGITLNDQAAGSTAANRIITGVGGSMVLAAGLGYVRLEYDLTTARWRVLSSPGVGQLRAVAFNSTTQSINTATVTAVTFDSESFDTAAFHSTVTNTSRLTIPAGGDGVYFIFSSITFAAGAGTLRQLQLAVNGTAFETVQYLSTAARPIILGVATVVAGDFIEVLAYQDSGGALNIGSGSAAFQNRLTAIKVG